MFPHRRLWWKRPFDLALSILAVPVALPLIGLCWVVARIDTGSGFYVQERVGLGGRPFRLLKVRTMRATEQGGTTTTADDPRVTRVGGWLRKLKLDELPQILNVLVGSMSLVGPRPTVLEDYERMSEDQRRRFTVRPGLTGMAQVSGNTSLSWPERIRYDLEYVDSASIRLDLSIMLRTLGMIVTARIETHPSGLDEWDEV